MILGTDVAHALCGPFLGACALLALAGGGKVARPAPARVAARAAGLRVSRSAIAVFGVAEIAAGGAGALLGGPAAFAVAACYLVLTVVAVRLLVRSPSTPCACLGSSKAVVTRTHVALDGAAVVLALAVGTSGGAPLAKLSGNWLAGSAFVLLVVCCVKLAMLALESLPDLAAATKEGTT